MSTCKPDIGFIPTPPEVVEAMLNLVHITQTDIIYDLGSGDGRILIEAAHRFGATGVGIDVDENRIGESRQKATEACVSHLITFKQQDLYESEFSEATIVVLYLLPHLNLKLRPRLFEQLKSGAQIISHDFDMGDWEPEQVIQIPTIEEEIATLYLWKMPADKKPHCVA